MSNNPPNRDSSHELYNSQLFDGEGAFNYSSPGILTHEINQEDLDLQAAKVNAVIDAARKRVHGRQDGEAFGI